MELVADLFQQLFWVLAFFAVDEADDDAGHESAALLRLVAVVGGQALQAGILHCFLQIVTVGNRNWR